ncbi:hypothetical protein BYT27DRAFT_7252127 [Phlegmacium glaucopus]|nr:hypothetical protein BYT27DRAFT_7252127 [Phlegmacium glaucopus]
MNHTHQENRYKFFCTTDPTTWEIIEGLDRPGTEEEEHRQRRGVFRKESTTKYHKVGGGTGRLAGGQRGEENIQRTRDNGWERIREELGSNGGRDTDNWREGPHSEENKRAGKEIERKKEAGKRSYRQDIHKNKGPTQTTLIEAWANKDTRSWAEQLEEIDEETERDRQNLSSALSYV